MRRRSVLWRLTVTVEGDELYTRSYSIKPKEPRGRLRKLLNQIADA